MTELILYTTEDGRSQIKLRANQQTGWLTQLEMAELFDATKVSHEQMERSTSALYLDYDQRRKQDEVRQADEQDEAELKALENALKKRPKP